MTLEIVLLILGLAGLWGGTELVVKGAIRVARYFGLSEVFVGLTILAVGTDLPETVLSINAALDAKAGADTSGLILGNALGSSFGQISLVMGIAGLIGYLTLLRRNFLRDGVTLLGATLLVFFLGYDGEISAIDGAILLVSYVVYYISLFNLEKAGPKPDEEERGKLNIVWNGLLLLLGIGIVVFAAELVVSNALAISRHFDLDQGFVGTIFLGLGTSLPELAISIQAASKKSGGLSVGNLIGSNIFDLTVPIGAGALITDLRFSKENLWLDMPGLFFITALMLFFFRRKKGLQKIEAVILIGLYVLYAVLNFFIVDA